jgi:hypothetical protein
MANFIANFLESVAASTVVLQAQQRLQGKLWIGPSLMALAAFLGLRRNPSFRSIVWKAVSWLVPPIDQAPIEDTYKEHQSPLLVIGFDYVPARQPTANGEWRNAESGEVLFSRPVDAPGDGYLQLDVPKRFAMDRVINEPSARLAKRMEFKTKLPRKAAIYAAVMLRDSAGQTVLSKEKGGHHWLTYCIGDEELAPTPDERVDNEVLLRMNGPVIGNGWTVCSRDLEADVRRAYPGFFFSSLEKIRIRGNESSISISPIRLFAH